MNNTDIILSTLIENNILTRDEIEARLKDGKSIDYHTVSFWNKAGYRVKKGEHAIAKTMLWGLKHSTDEADDATLAEDDEKEFVLRPAYLFSRAQVEVIKPDEQTGQTLTRYRNRDAAGNAGSKKTGGETIDARTVTS